MRKPQTNSPLQALTLMNNVVFVESARMLAERMLREGGDSVSDQIGYGFRVATGRRPGVGEVAVLSKAHLAYQAYFADRESAAKELLQTGEHPAGSHFLPTELAAMTMVASTLLNLDEAITKR